MKSDDIDDILSNIDEEVNGAETLKNLQKEKNKPFSSPIEHLKAKLENKEDDLSFLYDIDSDFSNESIVLKSTALEESRLDEDEDKDEKEDEIKRSRSTIKSKKTTDKIESVELKIKGTSTWNTREPYIVRINTGALTTDYKDLEQSFYFIKSNERESVIIGEMKRAMFKFVRGSVHNFIDKYSDFLYKKISDTARELCNDFGFSENELPFFIYHLGIFTLHVIVVSQLKENKTGFCFKLSSDSKVMRYIPTEYIKEIIITWHNDHIFNAEFPFDGIIEFNDLKRKVSARYMADVEKNNDKIESLIKKTDIKSISGIEKDNVIKNIWAELIGRKKIVTYNRFLERTVFKGNT